MFLFIAYTVCNNLINPVDEYVYVHIIKMIHPISTTIFKIITTGGSLLCMAIIGAIVYYKNHKIGKILLLHLIIIDILNFFFKMLFSRERPDILRLIEIDGYSFPSGHAMVSFCFYGLCLYFLMKSNFPYKKIGCFIIVVLILLIGISRIYLGVHYFSDVLAGFLCSLSYLLLIINNSSLKT